MSRAVIACVRRVCGRFVLATAILLSAADTLTGAEWNDIGSGLPRTTPAVKSLVIDPATPTTVYAIDNNGRLFKSIDSGRSWNARGRVAGVTFVVVDPTDSSTIYSATERGILKSTDGGENWASADNGLADSSYVRRIAIDPLTPATLYAMGTGGIFKSTDAARSWSKLDSLPQQADATYFWEGGLTIDPITPSTIYVDFNEGILKSTDRGQSWSILSIPRGNIPLSPHGLVIDPITSSTLYARSSKFDGNILKSTDGGATWRVQPVAPPGALVSSLAVDPISPSTVYAVYWTAPGWGISKSVDGGENWSALNTGLPDSGLALIAVPWVAVSPGTPATVYTGYFLRPSGGHLAESSDGGITWNAADAGLTYIDVRAMAIDPANPSNIYAGMGGTASSTPLFNSADGGASWNSLAQFQFGSPEVYGWISAILVGSGSPNSILAAANSDFDSYATVFKTTDTGANWSGTTIRGAEMATGMTLDTADSKTIYLEDYEPGGDGQAYLRNSVDAGSTWTATYCWLIGPVNALVIDPTNRATLYAGTPEGVFQSADTGVSWNNIGLMNVTSLALDPADSNTIYAATGNFGATILGQGFLGLFKSTDGGATWAPINGGLGSLLDSRATITSIAFASDNPGALYVATSGRGVYKSLDGGATWRPLNEGLANLDVRLLTVASNALYAVTSNGIFKAID